MDAGERVIDASIGGLRDPFNPRRDTYSRVEASAIDYAVSRDVVLVAAVGNSDDAPQSPWPFASYPAALPHVIGVSALSPTGNVQQFSNRDRIYNGISAPGQGYLLHRARAPRCRCRCGRDSRGAGRSRSG